MGTLLVKSQPGSLSTDCFFELTLPLTLYDVSLATKGRVYNATVRSTLLYGCETWPLRSGDLHRLQVFEHRCLQSTGHFSWKQRITDDEVRHCIFGDPKSSRRLNQIILGTRLRWLGYVLKMNSSRLRKNFIG